MITYFKAAEQTLLNVLSEANDVYVSIPGTEVQVVATTKEFAIRMAERTFSDNKQASIRVTRSSTLLSSNTEHIVVVIVEVNARK